MAGPAHALIVADGDVDVGAMRRLVPGPPDGDEILLIAADGGAAKVLAADRLPDIVVGDFDSLHAAERVRLQGLGIDLREARADKDESDMELCILTAIEAGAARISILGALGGSRPEHTLANIWLLADPRFAGVEDRDPRERLSNVPGGHPRRPRSRSHRRCCWRLRVALPRGWACLGSHHRGSSVPTP